jgi:hypothetical protein
MKKFFFIGIFVAFVFLITGSSMAIDIQKPVEKQPMQKIQVKLGCPSGFQKVSDNPLKCVKNPPANPCPPGYKYEAGPCPSAPPPPGGFNPESGPSCAFKCMPTTPVCNFSCPTGYMKVCGSCEVGCLQLPK